MPRLSAGVTRLANRQLVLDLHALEPNLKATGIGRRLGINESTVRSILSRYGSGQAHPVVPGVPAVPPPAHRGAGRPAARSRRWKRCDINPLCDSHIHYCLSFHSALLHMVKKDPFQSLQQLATAMYKWETDMLAQLPPGAVYRVPRRPGTNSILRYANQPKCNVLAHSLVCCRYLRAMGLKNRRAAKVPMLTKAHKKSRLLFANNMIGHAWSNVCIYPLCALS